MCADLAFGVDVGNSHGSACRQQAASPGPSALESRYSANDTNSTPDALARIARMGMRCGSMVRAADGEVV